MGLIPIGVKIALSSGESENHLLNLIQGEYHQDKHLLFDYILGKPVDKNLLEQALKESDIMPINN
jgi:hypothetical protein